MGQTLDVICMPTMVIQFSKFCPGQVSSLSLSLCPSPPRIVKLIIILHPAKSVFVVSYIYCRWFLFVWTKSERFCTYYIQYTAKTKYRTFRNKYSQKKNIRVSVPISTFMRLWVIYIFPRSVCLFCWRKYVDRSWDYINRSQTHECGNWGWGRAIPRKEIHEWDFRCSVFIVEYFRGW